MSARDPKKPAKGHGPAAGASGGAAPKLAAMHVSDFTRLEKNEKWSLLNALRDPLATHIYLLLLEQADFTQGEFMSPYARLQDLCTPPQPERGKRRPGPSLWQVRRVIDDLIKQGLVWRDAAANQAHGQLRLKVLPRRSKARPTK